ncbi:MAG: HAMP domain-containing histidine kinase [Anaerolineae bacterium]|nr:HAMP domain-containing histidine kinase [Anaerolineae bacterium]
MITTKSLTLNRLFKTPLHTAAFATFISLLLATVINVLFLSPTTLPMTLLITLVIGAPMSYLTIKTVFALRDTIEGQKIKLAIEHERAEILSKFMRDAAHEFKTPLTLMSTNLYLLEKTPDQEKKRLYTEQTYDQIQALNTLLETILILTRLDATDKTDYPREPVKAAELLTDIRSFNSNARIKMLVENTETLPVVQVNLADLHLALTQIIGNALRFSPTESDVTLQVAVSGQWLSLQISDGGQGMSAETLPHIFDRFYRVDATHTTRGLGLGLAIAKRVFELHDGHIEVQSEIGKGTSFKAYLPIARAK